MMKYFRAIQTKITASLINFLALIFPHPNEILNSQLLFFSENLQTSYD
jgi:hypothetical protein